MTDEDVGNSFYPNTPLSTDDPGAVLPLRAIVEAMQSVVQAAGTPSQPAVTARDTTEREKGLPLAGSRIGAPGKRNLCSMRLMGKQCSMHRYGQPAIPNQRGSVVHKADHSSP